MRARRTPYWERVLKLVRRRPTAASLLAVACLIASILLVAGIRSSRDLAAANCSTRINGLTGLRGRRASESWREVREHKIDDATAMRKPVSTGRRDQSGAQAGRRARRGLRLARRVPLAGAAALERYREFFRRHEDALFQDTELTSAQRGRQPGGDPQVELGRARNLRRTGARCRRRGQSHRWTDLSEPERKDVVLGCYEMLIVLAEAVALPLPGETAQRQARRAIRILDRAAVLFPEPTHAIWLRRAACLERCGDLEGAKRAKSTASGIQPGGALDHFLSGLERYKQGLLPQAKLHFEAALRAKSNHFWGKCLMAICGLNSRPPNPAEARTYLTACLQDHPDLPWLYVLRGFAYGQSGATATDPVEAEAHFEAALADYREAVKCDSARQIPIRGAGESRAASLRAQEFSRSDRRFDGSHCA